MKRFILFLFSVLLMFSCTKTNSTPKTEVLYSDYQFKIVSMDLDNVTISQTSIWNFGISQSLVEVTDDGGGGDDCHGDNGRTNPRCQSMPVVFGPVSFVKDQNTITATWVALLELNVKAYYIEASTDNGTTWQTIQTIKPQGQGTTYKSSFALWAKK